MRTTHLVIGAGEVGSSLASVLSENPKNEVLLRDKNAQSNTTVDVMHICFPYSDKFKDYVLEYIKEYHPKLVIVHSTVPVGTCDSLGVVHSPVKGVHPNLAEGIKTFTKYFGGKSARKAAQHFKKLGIKTATRKFAKDTEAAKFWSTSYYGINIIFEKLMHKWCQENGIDFDFAYTQWNKDYNEGYQQLGMSYVVRPILKHKEGEIGGHCVVQNLRFVKSPVADFIKKQNCGIIKESKAVGKDK